MVWIFRGASALVLFFWADVVAIVLAYSPLLLLALFLSSETGTVIVDRLK